MIDEGDYYVKFHLCNKSDMFKWALAVVYGPAQNEHKEQFLAELVNMCSHENLPLIVGGDYNILRHPLEKNNDHYNNRWLFLFNSIIDGLDLREL
jgi:exonuclease III